MGLGSWWHQGRQNHSYWKLELANNQLFKFDAYLLKYESGAYIKCHTDPSPLSGHKHMRLNIVLKKPIAGGFFKSYGWHKTKFYNRFILFRSDEPHEVTQCAGNRWVLSIGWLIKDKACEKEQGVND